MQERKTEADVTAASDEDLVAGVLGGREDCFTALYERHFDKIVSFAARRLGDATEAEDVAQEVFLQLHRGLERFEGRSSLLTWIFGISNNRVRMSLRKRRPRPVEQEDLEAMNLTSREPSLERRLDAMQLLWDCQRTLDERVSEDLREAFLLRYVDNRSVRLVAEELGKTTQAIKTGLHRVRRTLSRRAPHLHGFLDVA